VCRWRRRPVKFTPRRVASRQKDKRFLGTGEHQLAALRRAIFLDRDGTINHDPGFVHRVEDLQLLAGAAEGLRRLAQAGYRLVIVTNQSGVARGYFEEDQMHAFNAALVECLKEQGVTIDAVYSCPFHAEATVAAYRQDSPLRKPNPGMLLQAAAERGLDLSASWAMGDKRSDVAAGRAAGCRTILLRPGAGVRDSDASAIEPDFVANDLIAAAEIVERGAKSSPNDS
jgi:D-glycero-D-manno-heptose 1,7-bisphosphate phosphatase